MISTEEKGLILTTSTSEFDGLASSNTRRINDLLRALEAEAKRYVSAAEVLAALRTLRVSCGLVLRMDAVEDFHLLLHEIDRNSQRPKPQLSTGP